MVCVEEETLAERSGKGPLALEQLFETWSADRGRAGKSTSSGIAHRDLKPGKSPPYAQKAHKRWGTRKIT